MDKLITDFKKDTYRSIMTSKTYELASYSHNDGYNNVYVVFNQYEAIILYAWTEFIARLVFNDLIEKYEALNNKRFKVIADLEYSDGTKSYGMQIALVDTLDEAKDKVALYNNLESEICYENFDIIDRQEGLE